MFMFSGKWGDTEIEMLRDAIKRFGEDLKKISEIITTKSMYGLSIKYLVPYVWRQSLIVASLLFRAQIKSALKQRVYEQNYTQPSPRKTPQKRTAKDAEAKTDEVAAKKIKQGMIWTNPCFISKKGHWNGKFLEPSDVASSSEQKEGGSKIISPAKETENEVDVESIEENSTQNTQSMLSWSLRCRP